MNVAMSLDSSFKVNMKSDFKRLTEKQPSPYHQGLNLWDSSPQEPQNEPERSIFKKKYAFSSNELLVMSIKTIYFISVVGYDKSV